MQMNHASFSRSPDLRRALKRGLARQAITQATPCSADLPALLRTAAALRPNRKGLERLVLRLRQEPGVVRAALMASDRGVSMILRLVRNVVARVEGTEVFHETGLIYLRARIAVEGGRVAVRLSAISFCQHALERLVERSQRPLDQPLLPAIDAEVLVLLRDWDKDMLIEDSGDQYYRAAAGGVWAGSHDQMALETDWGLTAAEPTLPIFSVRTFLSEAEMRPTLWLRWNDDPTCRVM